ncbi:hypothetical protein JCM8097_007931 [Rhodosporidiobolus ruineniae]
MPYSAEDFAKHRTSTANATSAAAAPPAAPLTAPSGQNPADYDAAFRGRGGHTKFADPCSVAREESMRCLNDNAYDKTKCTAYRDCKKTWLEQRREDRRAGKDVA